jgi:hypothetical protein
VMTLRVEPLDRGASGSRLACARPIASVADIGIQGSVLMVHERSCRHRRATRAS